MTRLKKSGTFAEITIPSFIFDHFTVVEDSGFKGKIEYLFDLELRGLLKNKDKRDEVLRDMARLTIDKDNPGQSFENGLSAERVIHRFCNDCPAVIFGCTIMIPGETTVNLMIEMGTPSDIDKLGQLYDDINDYLTIPAG